MGLNWTVNASDNVGINWSASTCEVRDASLNPVSAIIVPVCSGTTCSYSATIGKNALPPFAGTPPSIQLSVHCTVVDTSGNVGDVTCDGSFTVKDATKPECNELTGLQSEVCESVAVEEE